jgi:hypothetical protein
MAYNVDLTWTQLTSDAGFHARTYLQVLTNGNDAYNEWQSFRAGRTNLEIATALGRTEIEVADMDAAYAALKLIYDYGNNQVPAQADYFYSLRKFS